MVICRYHLIVFNTFTSTTIILNGKTTDWWIQFTFIKKRKTFQFRNSILFYFILLLFIFIIIIVFLSPKKKKNSFSFSSYCSNFSVLQMQSHRHSIVNGIAIWYGSYKKKNSHNHHDDLSLIKSFLKQITMIFIVQRKIILNPKFSDKNYWSIR